MNLAAALRISAGDVVAFTGSGGKSTAMFRLARELAPQMRVLLTTSTRIFAAQIQLAPAHQIFNPDRQSLADVLPRLNHAIDQFGQVLLVGPTDKASGKAFGIAPQTIDTLAQTGQFDAILIEADGSRMRPFKAPADHEPVIPAATSLVVPVVGLDVLGRPLSDEFVHRAALVSRLSGQPLNRPVSEETIAAVLSHPAGGLKTAPPRARIIPLLNKVETEEARAAAQRVTGQLLHCPQIDSVVIGAVNSSGEPVSAVSTRSAVVVLAAGGATRFGSPKQLARWQNSTLIERAADTALASQADWVAVVLGHAANRCRAALGNRPVQMIDNPRWAEGQSTSMQAGLAALPAHTGSVIFMLVDQPAIDPTVIDLLIERHRATLAPVIWPEFEGRRGNPVLFDRTVFAELARVRGDTGGRPVLLAHANQAAKVAVSEMGILLDIDRPEDLP
jgi:molybdenum cofactor cytidylyltransferase